MRVRFSRQLLFYPAITFVDAIFARFILNFLVHIIVFVIIITGINLIYDTKTILNFPPIILSLTLAALLGLGIGCLNCFLFSVFPLWERLWAVLNRPLFILSAVLFLFERIPEPYRSYLWYNPIIHIVGIMRSGFYPAYDSSYTSAPYVILISLITLNLGILFLNRFHRYILNY
ncbi:MAG: ABC transporter permease [Rhodobacterales bacterium]